METVKAALLKCQENLLVAFVVLISASVNTGLLIASAQPLFPW
jgi:hypothetical protein